MKKFHKYILVVLSVFILISCEDDFLTENPKDEIYAENLYSDYDGFKNTINALYAQIRAEREEPSSSYERSTLWKFGTDSYWANYASYSWDRYTFNPEEELFSYVFNWLYSIINTSNGIINRAQDPEIDWKGANDAENENNKNTTIALARLFRAWAYRHLTFTWGDVPLSLEEINGNNYRTDWPRTSRDEIWEQMIEDLTFAENNLPDNYSNELILPNVVAQHYLAELYLAMNENDKAEQKALAVANNNNFKLITNRYGVEMNLPGVPFMDQFKDGNSLPSQGNTEALWVFLNEPDKNGSGEVAMRRNWVNRYYLFAPVSGENGGRGIGRGAFTYWAYQLYEDQDDRYSHHAIRKYYIATNGDTIFTRVLVTDENNDQFWPSTRKWDYIVDDSRVEESWQYNDMPYLRLAETYLLLAEAQLKLNKTQDAASWINKLRERSNATPITADQVTIEFILEERTRELLTEEHRRHTLNRLGVLVERTRELHPRAGERIQPHHNLLPLPQDFLDTNTNPSVVQNPGY